MEERNKTPPAEDSSCCNPRHMNNTLDAAVSLLTGKADNVDSLDSDT